MKKIMLVLVLMLSGLVFAQEKKTYGTGSYVRVEDGWMLEEPYLKEFIHGTITAIIPYDEYYLIKIAKPTSDYKAERTIELYVTTKTKFFLPSNGLISRTAKVYQIGPNFLCLEITEHMPED